MLEIDSTINGTYKILNKIGQGGMSVVYLALNERANKQWAIKELRKDGIQDFEVVRQGLIAETNILKKLSHPNLPDIIDVIDEEDSFLIVMDFIEGKPLNDLLKEHGAQPQEDVIEWGKQLCHVLNYLHAQNPPIIYRDMKPANIMLKPDGNVTLIDFGTAREFKSRHVEDTTCLGTRGYAAPEQFGGHGQTDARTDIYCLGATLYHLVTGHNPAEPPYEIYPIRYWNENLSTGLEKILLKCTQFNPKDRYQNCNELFDALEHYKELDESFLKSQKKKMIHFSLCAGFTVLFGLGALFCSTKVYYLKSRNYEAYLERAAHSSLSDEKDKNYKEAIRLNPGSSKAYLAMLEDYLKDEEFSVEDEQKVASALYAINGSARNIDYLKKNKEEYIPFCFQMGINYFFKYKGTQGKYTAKNWFDPVINTKVKSIDPLQKKRAEIYSRIGSYYEALGKEDLSGENTIAGYHRFFEDLSKLNQNEFIDVGNKTTALTLYNEIAVQISDHAEDFLANGVTQEKIYEEINKIENRIEKLDEGKEDALKKKINHLKNNLISAKRNVEIAYNSLSRRKRRE